MKICAKVSMILAASVLITGIVSCEDEDSKSIFEAQNCLDEVNENLGTAELIAAANACEAKLGSLDSAQANIIKCSTRFLAGGVTSSRIASAFSNNEDGGAANQEKLITVLSFTNYPSAEANSKVSEALIACEKSEQKGLIFIAGLSKIGTIVLVATGNAACMGFGTCDLDAISNPLGGCGGSTCNPAEVGNTAILLSDNYCTEDKEDDPFCQDVSAAVASGSDPAVIGAALIASMQVPN